MSSLYFILLPVSSRKKQILRSSTEGGKGSKAYTDSGSLRSLKLQYNFLNGLFSFWGSVYKNIQLIQKVIPLKKFLESLSLFI